MGLSDVFQSVAQTAANVFSDVYASVRYEAHGSTLYNVSTGLTDALTGSYFVSMLFETYAQHQIDGVRVLPTDVKASIPQLNLVPYPDLHDQVHAVEAEASVSYEIKDVSQDPAGALWEFQLRRS